MRSLATFVFLVVAASLAGPAMAQSADDRAVVREALANTCAAPAQQPVAGASRLKMQAPQGMRQPPQRQAPPGTQRQMQPGQRMKGAQRQAPPGTQRRMPQGAGQRSVAEWRLKSGDKLRVSSLSQQGQQLIFVDLYSKVLGAERAVLRGVARGDCSVAGGRFVEYGKVSGKVVPTHILELDRSLLPNNKVLPLNPVPPKGNARNCVRVGLLDNGVNYTRSDIAKGLAYNSAGRLIGLDVWENDGRPFDYGFPENSRDPRISIFNPNRHGSMVASVILDYAPGTACIVPVRYYPMSTGNEVSKAADFFANQGVKVVSLQSSRRQPWPDFQRAMKAHPEMLFVVAAGNNRTDLNRVPLYPPAYQTSNLLVVAGTASNDRSLWKGSNFGSGIVEIAVGAENVALRKFDGESAALSGTSFAAPKVSAYAAKLIARNPRISGAELKQLILSNASGSQRNVQGMPVLTERILRSN
ncbi:S8 family serine peptidase [Aliiruegeria sabulilitoris]|uniref:S8 family serine peptidase n=1 Tax=Aliiruegeria sabulilitoris TaxID=1510458 RepID=UPI000834F20A|nr:S8 family serine peptidase [Aliiruegeria sabulilitoris]NDR57027.1 S8 family serine peptidase [Pseudoruegeria sp. M32A2M]